MKKLISCILSASLILTLFTGCGKEQKPSGPVINYIDQDSTEKITTEADVPDILATVSDADKIDTGYYGYFTYYNPDLGFQVNLDGYEWRMYDCDGVAAATGILPSDLAGLWMGTTTPYDWDMSYCAIFYNYSTMSNIVVSYFNPKFHNIGNMDAKKYLEMCAGDHENAVLGEDEFVGKTFQTLKFLPTEGEEAEYLQTIYAYDEGGLIVLLTFTLREKDTINTVSKIFSTGEDGVVPERPEDYTVSYTMEEVTEEETEE